MTDEAIEAAARAIRGADSWRTWKGDEAFAQMARAAAPALMEEGARLALEAAANIVKDGAVSRPRDGETPVQWQRREILTRISHLDPAAIVKGAGHDRD